MEDLPVRNTYSGMKKEDVNDKEEEWSIVIPGASTTGQWQESDLTEAGKLAKNIISNWPD